MLRDDAVEAPMDLGAWRAIDPAMGAAWFAGLDVPWWVAGGWALDLYLGRQSRTHEDLDVGILRRDIAAVRARLSSWEMFEAKDGKLTRLDGDAIPGSDVHSLWCRPDVETAWTLELVLDDADRDTWIYRRKPSIRRPLTTISAQSTSGIPYLAPEIQLLYKAKWLRPRDQQDFETIAPRLDPEARAWLARALNEAEPGHPWTVQLR